MNSIKKFAAIATIAAAALVFVSCDKDNTPDNPNNGNETVLENGGTLQGSITKDTKLPKGGTYYLKAGVHVKSGATLTIEEGVTVKSVDDTDPTKATAAYLAVEPGGKINAVGTATAPIVFTSGKANPQPQDWGGIILCGKAKINYPGGTATSEMADGVTYGGNDDNDNSGVMKYVRVEYTGKIDNAEKEHNGFTFEGVGAGTVLEHLAVYKGSDDGIEFFGGNVNLKYAVVYGAEDDMYDQTFGWRGKGQFWVGIQGANADKGFEFDNNGSDNKLEPYSNPTISNVTLVGNGKTGAMKLREGTKGKIINVVAYNFAKGIDVEMDQTLANMNDGSLYVKSTVVDKPFLYTKYTGTTKPFEGADYKNSVITAVPTFISNVYVGTSATNATDTKSVDAWFDAANYIGAVPSNNNWVGTGTWAKVQ